MIISASRRTDIPALYCRWLATRLRAGYCVVPNPFNPRQQSRVSLRAEDVDAIVFWTRHASPIMPLLPWLRDEGYRFYFHYTITGYGRPTESRTPPLPVALRAFCRLADALPPGSVIWRYDPIIVGPAFSNDEHVARFAHIAAALAGRTQRVVVSLLSLYRKTERRLGNLFGWEDEVLSRPTQDPASRDLLARLCEIASKHAMTMEACAQLENYTDIGIPPTRCIDDALLGELFGGRWVSRKDPGQRRACRCIPSKDIGMPDTCTLGCAYCYATRSDPLAKRRFAGHNPQSPSLFETTAANV